MRKLFAGFVLLVVAFPLLSSRIDYKDISIKKIHPTMATKTVINKEPSKPIEGQFVPFDTVSKGVIVGCTQYDRQWNLSPLRRIIWNPVDNYTHVCWMKQLSTGGILRHMFYNCNDGTQWLWPGLDGGTAVQTGNRDGYGAMDIDMSGNAVVAMHKNCATEPTLYYKTCIYRDVMSGMGSFELVKEFDNVPTDSQDLWPRVAVDGVGNMIVLACADTTIGQPKASNKLYYSRCSGDSLAGGGNWSPWAVIDTNTGLSYNVFASKKPGSQNMCMVWNKDVQDGTIWNGHMVYRTSSDGGRNFAPLVDVMDFIPNPTSPRFYELYNFKGAIGNSYGIFGADENVLLVTDASLGTPTQGNYYPGLSCVIWFYSPNTGLARMVSYYPYPANLAWYPASSWDEVLYPYYGGLQAKPVIGEDPVTKYLYVIWIEFPMDTFSINGYEAGEIYASYSLDRGWSWAPKINLTNTPTMCEVFASLAPVVNDTLHMLYMYDLDGYDDIIQEGFDPNKCQFFSYNEPVKRGDIEVLSINSPSGDTVADTLYIDSLYTPCATYKNNGTTSATFQARFEILTANIFLFGDSASGYDTLLTPSLWHYDVQNITLAAGETTQVVFKSWLCNGDSTFGDSITRGSIYYYMASASMLVDTVLDNNVLWTVPLVGVEESSSKLPRNVTLSKPYPNPSNRNSNINYSLSYTSNVTIKVYDIAGKFISKVVDRNCNPGSYIATWDGKDSKGNKVAAGLYFYRVEIGSKTETGKILRIR